MIDLFLVLSLVVLLVTGTLMCLMLALLAIVRARDLVVVFPLSLELLLVSPLVLDVDRLFTFVFANGVALSLAMGLTLALLLIAPIIPFLGAFVTITNTLITTVVINVVMLVVLIVRLMVISVVVPFVYDIVLMVWHV
jgi:hypothetical protein